MKILLTVDPEIPVPPQLYGGIERIVSSLCKAYTAKGHTVYLLAHPDSDEPATRKIFGWQGLSSRDKADIVRNTRQLNEVAQQVQPDIVHSFSRLLYTYPLLLQKKVPVVQSYQRKISPHSTRIASMLGGSMLHFTACGAHTFSELPNKHKWTAIWNFTNTAYFVPDAKARQEYLFFLGRIEDIKGTKEAIQAAIATGEKLIIAGNIDSQHQHYFDTEIKPHLSHPLIEYVGTVDDKQKLHYLQRTKALLFPIKWEEPFGIVMAESMACGTPVIGFKRGSVPEVIVDGQNGFQANNVEEMAEAIRQLPHIDRFRVREHAVRHFSTHVVSEQYLKLFEDLIARNRLAK